MAALEVVAVPRGVCPAVMPSDLEAIGFHLAVHLGLHPSKALELGAIKATTFFMRRLLTAILLLKPIPTTLLLEHLGWVDLLQALMVMDSQELLLLGYLTSMTISIQQHKKEYYEHLHI
jgi:hypothetical protein